MAELTTGCVITLTDGRQATVRFLGATSFADGEWIGVELTDDSGKNDGSVQGERYFDCEPGYGMFVRPTAVASIIERPVRTAKPAAKPGTVPSQSRSRAQSGLSAAPGLKRPGSISAMNSKRNSASSSPTPTPKGPAQRPSLKAPSKSPTKQLTSANPGSRPSISGTSRPSVAAPKARPTTTKSTMGPPPQPTASRPARTSLSGPGNKGSRQSLQGPGGTATSGLSKRPTLRPTGTTSTSDEASPAAEDSEIHNDDTEGGLDMDDPASKLAPSARTSSSRMLPGQPASPRQPQNMAITRELDELKTKLKKLKNLEQLQADRDKLEGIIRSVQTKFQPHERNMAEMLEEVEKLLAEHDSLMEIASLDREMAVEMADAHKMECETLRLRVEELELEVETMNPEDKSSHGWLQMEKTNERLREALIRLRDMTQQQEAELKDQIKELQQDLEDYEAVRSKYETTKEKLLKSENNLRDLKERLDSVQAQDELVEEMVEKNMVLQKEIDDLKADIAELEWNHVETEKQLQEEIEISQQDEVIEDLEYTLTRFRDLVSNLQADLEDMRASQQITEAEATDLTARSRAMMDLNLKLQSSVAKAQTKTIDIELKRIEAEENTKHLSILKLYLPAYFEDERNSVLALLRFKRGMISEQASVSPALEDIFTAHDVLEKLLWIDSICGRFGSYITNCSAESFGGVQGAFYELEPKNEINMKKCAVELQRSISLLSHLAETLLPTSLETFADELCMSTTLTLSYIENSSKLPKSEEDDEEATFLYGKIEVATAKINRAVDDLRSRSLALLKDACGSFKQAEDAAKDLSSLSRQMGENIVLLISDDILTSMSQQATRYQSETTENNDGMSLIFTMLRSLSGTLEELGSISSDLSITSEFEKRPSPWIARSAELKSNKANSPDAEEELRRLKNELHEAATALGVKDKTIEEQAIKVELVESRMRDASKKAAAVKDLEAKIEEMALKESELKTTVEAQRKDLQGLEAERDEIKAQLERVKRLSGTAGASASPGAVVDNAASLAAMQENEALRAEVESLQSAVRFLREENRRQTILDPYSVQRSSELYSWLDAPLFQKTVNTTHREKIQQTASESRDVLSHLLKLTKESSIADLKSTRPTSGTSTGWRPSKEKLKYQVLQQRENFERWAEWKDEVVGLEREQDRLATAKQERFARGGRAGGRGHASHPSMGYGMMGRAWQILGMQQDRKANAAQPVEPVIEPTF
ncbi:dynein associated protein-domain-containing protein [Aspergillus multicolor]|uniref:putative dynactin n=1 Tax=Aspergillus multicolor TaxID=41759 RepID=UPI003CCDE9C6